MKYMNWSWADLMSTPTSVVLEVMEILTELEEERTLANLRR